MLWQFNVKNVVVVVVVVVLLLFVALVVLFRIGTKLMFIYVVKKDNG